MSDFAVLVENVSKKYCKSLKRSMIYGSYDIARNIVGLKSHSNYLRKNEFWALDEISFTIKEGTTLGIVGPNGAGKTTLLKMLNGIFWPDKGTITIKGHTGALIELGAGFHPLLTGRENIYINGAILGMTRQDVKTKFDDIVEFADIGDFLDTPVKHYSSGMFVKLGFAIAVHCEPDILLIDEVLAVGDKGFQAKCFNKLGELRKKGITTIIVSHNTHAISTFSNNVLLVQDGKVKFFDNPFDGTNEYSQLFNKHADTEAEKILSGNNQIDFYEVKINKDVFTPGDSFVINICYRSSRHYNNVEIDTGIYTNNEMDFYFQATNKTYCREIDLLEGVHQLRITINDIPINNASAVFAFAIWSENREEKLFWWRIPVRFENIGQISGKNYFCMDYTVNRIE